MSLSTIIAFVRNGLCCIKDLNLFSSSILFDPSYTYLVFSLPPPHLNQTTPLELLIGILQFYAFISLTWEGIQSIKRGIELKRSVQRAKQKVALQQEKKYFSAYRIVKQKLHEDAASATKAIIQGFWVACIGISFFWLFANSFHVTQTNVIGGVQALIHALTVAEIALLFVLYYMITDAAEKLKNARRIQRTVIPKLESSGGRLGQAVTEDFFDANIYSWIIHNGWSPYWTIDRSGESTLEEDAEQIQQEIQRVQLTVDTLLAVGQGDTSMEQMLKQAADMACQRLTREAWILHMTGVLECFLVIFNVVAFYGYMLSVLSFYLAEGEDAPSYWKSMKFGLMKNADADWAGNFAGDLMWTIEPFTLIVAPHLLVSMAPTGISPKSKKVKTD